MRLLGPAGLSMMLLAGCASAGGEDIYAHPEPSYVPYRCADGHMARLVYEHGGWFVKARASLAWDGRTIELQASPPTYGLRYVSADDAADPVMIWTVRGEEAWLSEIARNAAPDAPARELAHCTRVREGAEAPAAAEGGEAH
jgi:hypothetical protein